MKILKTLLISLLTLFSNALSAKTVLFTDSSSIVNIGEHCMILEDKTNKLSFQDVRNSDQFQVNNFQVPNFQVSKSTFWIKFEIKNLSKTTSLLLLIAHPVIDQLELHTVSPNGNIVKCKSGEYQTISERKYKHQNYIFDIHINNQEKQTYFLKVRSGDMISVPISIGTPKTILQSLIIRDYFFGIYTGIIVAIFLYNLFIFFSVRDKSYLYYVIYVLLIGLTQATLHGYAYRYLWPSSSWMATQSIFIIPSLAGIAVLEFFKHFLRTKKYIPTLHKLTFILEGVYVICIILALIGHYHVSSNILDLNAMIISFYMLFGAYKISKKGYRPAKFFLIAWTVFLLGVIIFVLKNTGVLPTNKLTTYILPIGSALEVVLLSFALADRINIFRKEKEQAQLEKHRLLEKQTVILEEKVKERTAALEKAQSRLVQNEKMATVGQIAAGVAHEINNPINFISVSLNPLKRDLKDLYNVINKCHELFDGKNIEQKIAELQQLHTDLDIDYLLEEINHLLLSIEDGADRTTEIVRSLKTFSRVDEDSKKLANLIEGIESTLTILKSKIGPIQIIKNIQNTPKIECYPGQLNQVFMNIITNAIEAIQASNDRAISEGVITIQSEVIEDQLYIHIKDNGVGIPKKIQEKIFDPFFTTKDIGKGTGLGLSISYGIIEAHKGKLEVTSEEGEGTEFTIILHIN